MKHALRFLLCCLLALAAPAIVSAEETGDQLAMKWQPGMRYVQRITINQSSTLPGKDGPKAQHANITADEVITIREHPKRDWRYIGVSWSAFRISGANGSAKFAYDSARPGTGPDKATIEAGNAARAYLGREFLFQIDPKGNITITPEFTALVKEITQIAPDAETHVKAFFSKANLTQLLKLGTLPDVPEEPVKPGCAWPFETRFDIPIVGELLMDGTCSFQGRAKRGGALCAVVPLNGRLELMSSPQASLLGLKDATGELSGFIWFDATLGWARESVTTWDVTAVLGGIASAKDGSAQLVPLKQTMKVTLLKVERIS